MPRIQLHDHSGFNQGGLIRPAGGSTGDGDPATSPPSTGGPGGAVHAIDVILADALALFVAGNVEAALAELAKKDIGYLAHGNTGATETFDALTGWHSATLDANSTFTLTGATSGLVAAMVLELAQDGTGSRTVTWPGSVAWASGSAPTLSTTPADVDLITLFSRDGGTTWYGFTAGGGGESSSTGHYELLMAAGSSPIEPLETGDGLDWLYVWVTA